ncbi:MAG: chemotaxis protein CheX [Planctomycetaceae bacterium]
MSTAVAQSSAMTAEYINPVISATRTVFETMLNCTPTRTGLALKDDRSPLYELSAVIGISGKAAGTIVVSLSHRAALQVLSRMVGIEATSINTEVCDAVGELTNMIAGSAKAQMERLQLSISIPNVVSGKDHEVHFPSNVRPICIQFDSEIGEFAILVGFSGLN